MASRESGSPVNLITKYVMFLLNISIFLISGAVAALMAWVLVVKEKKVETVYDFFLDPVCVLCLAGSLAFVISFFGWYGFLREYPLFLVIYRYILMMLFLVEMVVIILIFMIVYVPDSRDQLGIYPEESLKQAIKLYRDDEDMQNLIDGIQIRIKDSSVKSLDVKKLQSVIKADSLHKIVRQLECCGTSDNDEGYKDWAQNPYFNCSTALESVDFGEYCSVPYSCCIEHNTGLVNYLCGRGMQKSTIREPLRASTIYRQGCFKAITDILQSNVIAVGGVIIAILIPQMFITSLTAKFIEQIEMQTAKWHG